MELSLSMVYSYNLTHEFKINVNYIGNFQRIISEYLNIPLLAKIPYRKIPLIMLV